MTLAQRLWRANADLVQAALGHPFVRGLADGTLPPDRFAGFIAQDAYFLECFARAYALGLAHSPDRAGLEAFADLIAGVREELGLHESYAQTLGIDLAGVEPLPATLAYTDFLLATAATGGVGQTCAATTPCMRLYAHIGGSLASSATSDAYTAWISTYAASEFEALASRLEQLLDTYGTDTHGTGVDRHRVDRLGATYRRAMRLEVSFFDAAWAGSAPPPVA